MTHQHHLDKYLSGENNRSTLTVAVGSSNHVNISTNNIAAFQKRPTYIGLVENQGFLMGFSEVH